MVAVAGVALALCAALFIGIQAVCVRAGTTDGSAHEALLVGLLVNTGTFLPLALVASYPRYVLSPASVAAFAAAGIVGTLLGRAFEYVSIERIGASRSEPVKSSQPLHAALLAVVFLGEPLGPANFAGILLIVVGVALVSWESAGVHSPAIDNIRVSDLFLPLLAAFMFGLEPIFATVGLATGTPVFLGLLVKTVAATGTFAAYLHGRGRISAESLVSHLRNRWYVLAGLANTLFLVSYYAGLAVSPVAVVVPIMQMGPLFVVAISWLFLQRLERVTPRLVLASTIIVLGGITITLTS